MSLNVALNTAVSGLFANQQAIAATSENIANVNTESFARREVTFYTDAIPEQFAGVSADIARAAADRFLQSASFQSSADAAGADALANALSNIEASLGAPGENISFYHAFAEAFAAFATLAANPQSPAAKADALAATDAAFASLARTREAAETEVEAADARLSADIARANSLLEEIFNLNAVIPSSDGAADLADARLTELSRLLSINVSRNDLGQVTVTSAGGDILADPAGYAVISATFGGTAMLSLGRVTTDGGDAVTVNDTFGGVGGEIGGLLEARNVAAPAIIEQVAAIETAMAGALNDAYALNTAAGATQPAVDALVVATGDGGFRVGAALMADPAALAIARPAAGATGGGTDGSGAAAIAAIGAGPLAQDMADAISFIGSLAGNAERLSQTNAALAADLEARVASSTGVNLDEELSNLIVYQRAYGANARVIAAVDELWQTLLNTI